MKTVYCELNDVGNHIVSENFLNPQFKRCVDKDGNEYRLHIILPQDKIEIQQLTKNDALYYCGRKESITMLTLNWFPKELVVGINGKIYSEDTKLSFKTGYVRSDNTGTSSECFLTEKVGFAIEILWGNGFEINFIKSAENEVITRWVEKLESVSYMNAMISFGINGIEMIGYVNTKTATGRAIKSYLKKFEAGVKSKIETDYKRILKKFQEQYT